MSQSLAWEKIHAAIHGGHDQVAIGNIPHKVELSKSNGCRFVWYTDSLLGKVMIMEQNKHKSSVYAERARKGETLSWVIPQRSGASWVLIDTRVPIPAQKEVANG